MKVLLDTHALLWWATRDRSLSARVKKAIADEASEVFVSAASAWEIATKVRIGKLVWPIAAGRLIDYVLSQGFRTLSISLAHAERAGELQIIHRDPFDRVLIVQALMEDMWLASNEDVFERAGVRCYW